MFTHQDEQRVRQIIKEELFDVTKTTNRTSDNVDKVLKIVTRTDQEHTFTQAKVNQQEKRLRKIERKMKIPPASKSLVI